MTVFINGTIGKGFLARGVTVDSVRQQFDEEEGDEITVAINSHGGDPFEGLAIMRFMQRRDERVVVEIDGLAASAASLVAMGGDEVRIASAAMMMIHNAWGVAIGDHHELRETADDFEEITESMSRAYDRADVDEDELRQMLDDETWMGADEAEKKGFVDTIIGEEDDDEETAARLISQINARHKSQLEDFERVPGQVAAMAYRTGYQVAAMNPAASTHRGADIMGQNETNGEPESAPEEQTVDVEANVVARESRFTEPVDTPGIDPDAVAKAERERIQRIQKAGRMAGLSAEAIDEVVAKGEPLGASLDMITDRAADKQRQTEGGSPIQSTSRRPVTGGQTGFEKFTEGVQSAIEGRIDHEQQDPQNPYTGFTLMELSREWLQKTGDYRAGMNRNEICAAIFAGASGNIGRHTTSDFPEVLKDVAHKTMQQRFEEVPTTYPIWTRSGQLNDFRAHHRVKLNQFPRFKEINPEKGDFEHATFGDRREEIFLSTYGQEFTITRQAIINDDLGAFTEIPGLMGEAAARSIQFLVSMLLNNGDDATDGQTMVSTGDILFHANHDNIVDEALTHDGLAAAEQQMMDQRDPDGEGSLLIAPEFLLVGSDLKSEAWEITQAPTRSDQENPDVPNQWGQLKLVVDPNLNYDGADGEDGNWYLAGPQSRSAVEVAGLNGPPTPQITQSGVGSAHGVEYEAFFDVGVRAVEEKSILKSTGGN